MYIAELLNQFEYFQYLAGWKKSSRSNGLVEGLNSLLFRGTSAVVHLQRIKKLKKICEGEFDFFENRLVIVDDRIVYNSHFMVELFHEISPLLSTLRIMQNMIVPLIGKELSMSVPSSLDDVIKKINSIRLPQKIKGLIEEYWRSSGQELRFYRDVDQHYDVLIKQSFMQIRPNKRVLICLPDNPEDKDPKKFKFKEQKDGVEFVDTAFKQLHDCIESIARTLGYSKMPLEEEMEMSQLGDLRPFRKRTLGLMVEYYDLADEKGITHLKVEAMEVGQNNDGTVYLRDKLKPDFRKQ